MRIPCPYCGERDAQEFTFLGTTEAAIVPAFDAEMAQAADDLYLRRNVAGPQREIWYHGTGCQCCLVVTRDTRDHDVLSVALAGASS